MKKAAIGAEMAALIPPALEMRVIASMPSHTTAKTRPIGQARPSATPIKVATPLPPRKRSQIGRQCPTTAARPAQCSVPGQIARAISTTAAPLARSSSNVAAASPLRPVRSTLVAPVPPDPISCRFPAPAMRVRITPNGIEPST